MCAGPIQARLRTRGESDDAGKYVEVLREEANTKGTLYCEVRLVGDVRGRAEWVRPEFLEYPRSSANIEDRAEQAEPSAYDFIPASGGATTQDVLAGFQVKQQAYTAHASCAAVACPLGARPSSALCAQNVHSAERERLIPTRRPTPTPEERLLETVERMLGNKEGLDTIGLDVLKELGVTTKEAVCDGAVNTAVRAGIIRKLGLSAASEAGISETDLTGAMWAGISRMVHRLLST